jgi:hypothetical protein
MPYDPDGYDYTSDDRKPVDVNALIDAFEIPDVAAIDKTADEIDGERAFAEVPVGTHDLVITGFLIKKGESSPFQRIKKDQYLDGVRYSLDTYAIAVKYALLSNPRYQVTDNFWLPPSDAKLLRVYYEGSKAPDSKPAGRGFMANKFYQFIDRLGFPYPKGGSLPKEARMVKNWIGRTIRATIVAGDAMTDQTTGEERPGRNQVKPFSYEKCGSPKTAQGSLHPPENLKNTVTRPAPSNAVTRKREPVETAASSDGLDNI